VGGRGHLEHSGRPMAEADAWDRGVAMGINQYVGKENGGRTVENSGQRGIVVLQPRVDGEKIITIMPRHVQDVQKEILWGRLNCKNWSPFITYRGEVQPHFLENCRSRKCRKTCRIASECWIWEQQGQQQLHAPGETAPQEHALWFPCMLSP